MFHFIKITFLVLCLLCMMPNTNDIVIQSNQMLNDLSTNAKNDVVENKQFKRFGGYSVPCRWPFQLHPPPHNYFSLGDNESYDGPCLWPFQILPPPSYSSSNDDLPPPSSNNDDVPPPSLEDDNAIYI